MCHFLEEKEVCIVVSHILLTYIRFYLKDKDSSELRQTIYSDPAKFGITNPNFMKVYVQKRNIILMAYLECRRDPTATLHNEEQDIPEEREGGGMTALLSCLQSSVLIQFTSYYMILT